MAFIMASTAFALKDRQKLILDAVIQEYIETAFPVASSRIVDKFKFPYSSATVRNELLALDEAGFLEQPHTSAGRIPTEKGYRFYIEEYFDGDELLEKNERVILSEIFSARGGSAYGRQQNTEEEFLKLLARTVSEISRSFTVAGLYENDMFYKTGISEAFDEPEFEYKNTLKEFSGLSDFIDEEIRNIFEPGDFKKPKAFVGKENPIREARNYGMVVSSVITPNKKETLVAVLGPKRMDYRKNISLFEFLGEL